MVPNLALKTNKKNSLSQMVKIKLAILRSTRAKDGSYKIRIAIGHKSETHYIVTPYSVPSLSNFRNGTIIGTPSAHHDNIKLRQLLTEYEERLERIPNPSDYTPVELRDLLKRMRPSSSNITALQLMDENISNLSQENRSTEIPTLARRNLSEFLAPDIPMSMITPATIDAFARHLNQKGYANASINIIIEQLRKIVNNAIRFHGIRYEVNPFAYYRKLPIQYHDIDISVSDFRKILHFQPEKTDHQIARHALLLSYYLGGINLVDLLNIDFRHTNGILDYVRHKTQRTSGTRVQLAIIPEAAEIISQYMDAATGKIIFKPTAPSIGSITVIINTNAKKMAEAAGIADHEKISYYTARKSFVQHGFDLGISLETLEYCIGHATSRRMIYNYMRIMRRHADKAIRLIVDHLHEKNAAEGAENG